MLFGIRAYLLSFIVLLKFFSCCVVNNFNSELLNIKTLETRRDPYRVPKSLALEAVQGEEEGGTKKRNKVYNNKSAIAERLYADVKHD